MYSAKLYLILNAALEPVVAYVDEDKAIAHKDKLNLSVAGHTITVIKLADASLL